MEITGLKGRFFYHPRDLLGTTVHHCTTFASAFFLLKPPWLPLVAFCFSFFS